MFSAPNSRLLNFGLIHLNTADDHPAEHLEAGRSATEVYGAY